MTARGGDFYLATSEDLNLATSGDFFMATDMGRHPSVRLVGPYRPKDGALMTTAEDRPCWNDM
jgi:hypothetical protein